MILRAVPSKWSTEVFGFRVGTLDLDESIKEEDRIENRGEFDVVFVKTQGWIDDLPQGAVAVDYLYDMELKSLFSPMKVDSVVKVESYTEERSTIAASAFSDSRFLRDPKLRDKTSDMYVRWLQENPAYVLTEDPSFGFLIPSMDSDGASRISLLAVKKNARRLGIGSRLVSGVIRKEPGIWRVRTSSRNISAIRFYEKLSFRMKSVTTVFHLWMRRTG